MTHTVLDLEKSIKNGRKVLDWLRFCEIATTALADGATLRPPVIDWDTSNNCENPPVIFLDSFQPTDAISPVVQTNGEFKTIHMHVMCRKCDTCLRARSRFWTARAIYEVDHAPRTWFATFTVNPYWRWKFETEIMLEQVGCDPWDFAHHQSKISKELTKYFKKIRRKGYQFRYLLVTEAHADGYPHFHALIHEVYGASPLRKRLLEENWGKGFTSFKLVGNDQIETSTKASRYVCKYLQKDTRARVRASQGYGRADDAVGIASSSLLTE